ncbi:alpha-amylase [Serratia fonticola]|uniref:alpha-amylase n=1 Tax=Serratia fonticola TaxID=47917 RepID=UPI0015C6182E|nr:alpha-amylase [Serratia fonticola]NXZ85993.1 alpha-amylase [Serratia fonticola]
MTKKTTLLQFFHWYYPDGGKLWQEVAERAPALAELGVTDLWLPPAYKGAAGGYSVGYDSYDLFDLGEFDQKGTRATKYGDKEALTQAVNSLREQQIRVIYDVVFNHKIGADEKEQVHVYKVDEDNRNDIAEVGIDALAYTRFTFPGRQGTYSKFIWDYTCFSGVDYIEQPDDKGIFKIANDYGEEGWNDQVDDENGNFDYLMGANVEFRNQAVVEELKYWARWLMEILPCDGFRLDATKHIPAWFFKDWADHVRDAAQRDLFIVAEYWSHDLAALQQYLALVDGKVMLFDVPLQLKFHLASKQGDSYDMSQLFTDTLVAVDPAHAVTLVANHDTQPLQSLEAPVEPWFKPLAYALILLREQGVPCLFYPDLYGASYSDQGDDGQEYQIDMPVIAELEKLIQARQRFANGEQHDYFDDPHCIAFSRSGTAEQPGCVVVMTNGAESSKTVALGENFAHKSWRDFLGNREDDIMTDEHGSAAFPVNGGSVSVWVMAEAE